MAKLQSIDDIFEKEVLLEIYDRSYYEFFKDAFVVLHQGEQYNDNWHIEYICNILQQELERIVRREPRQKDIIINVPFRAAKSMITTIIFPVWAWTKDPTMKFICTSYSGDLALEHAQRSRDLIESMWFNYLYGENFKIKDDQNAKGHYVTSAFGYRKSVGTGGQITGSGADIILLDDPQNPKKAASVTERKNTVDFYDHTLYSRLNQPDIGMRIIIQQRLHEDDLTGHLMKQAPQKHFYIKIPAKITERTKPIPAELEKKYTNGLFWRTRFSETTIHDYETILGATQSAGQLQQEPAPEEGNIIKRAWLEIIEPQGITRDVRLNPIMFYVDTAETEKTQNDPSAIIACFEMNNMLYIIDVAEVRKEFFKLCEFITEFAYNHQYTSDSILWVEPKSSGKSIISQLRVTTKLNVAEIKYGKGKMDDKITRVNSITPTLQAGRVKLIKGVYTKKLVDQLCLFPNSKHDDMTDVFTYAVENLVTNKGFDFAFLG